jgi:hypothetical protein
MVIIKGKGLGTNVFHRINVDDISYYRPYYGEKATLFVLKEGQRLILNIEAVDIDKLMGAHEYDTWEPPTPSPEIIRRHVAAPFPVEPASESFFHEETPAPTKAGSNVKVKRAYTKKPKKKPR